MVFPKEIKDMLEKAERDRETQSKLIGDIHLAIFGSEPLQLEGMAAKVKKHEKYISTDKKLKWILFGSTFAGIGGAWAYIKSKFGF